MKKTIWCVIICLILCMVWKTPIVFADKVPALDETGGGGTEGTSIGTGTSGEATKGKNKDDTTKQKSVDLASEEKVTEDSWISDAFSATKSFLSENNVKDPLGIAGGLLGLFKTLVNIINRVLLVALAGISAIALSIVGIRYMNGFANPGQISRAKDDFRTVFKGMAYGFGAYFIWRIAMSIVSVIIGSF